jgi:hypothetical protein
MAFGHIAAHDPNGFSAVQVAGQGYSVRHMVAEKRVLNTQPVGSGPALMESR